MYVQWLRGVNAPCFVCVQKLLVWMLSHTNNSSGIYYSSVCFSARFFSYKYWAIESIKMFSFLRTLLLLFSNFYTLGKILQKKLNISNSFLWGIFQISFCYNLSIRSAIGNIQLSKHSALSALCFSLSYFSKTKKKKVTLTQMGKASNPLQNSSTFNLFFSLILWARDTIQL